MSYKDDWKAKRRLQRTAKPPIHPLPKDEIDRRFVGLDSRLMLYFPEGELDIAALGYVLAHAGLDQVRELWIDSAEGLDDHALALILAAPLQKLEVLGLRGWNLTGPTLQSVLDAPALLGLRELSVSPGSPNPWPWTSVRLDAPTPPTFPTAARLERVLFGYRCTSAVANTLATHPSLAGLQTLNLAHTGITDTEAAILATARQHVNLRSLNLSLNQIGPAGAASLGAAPWPALEKLELVGNRLGAEGMQALGTRTGLPRLRQISLAANGLPDIEFEVKISDKSSEEWAQWTTDNNGAKPPTHDYIERFAVSPVEIAKRFFPGQSMEVS